MAEIRASVSAAGFACVSGVAMASRVSKTYAERFVWRAARDFVACVWEWEARKWRPTEGSWERWTTYCGSVRERRAVSRRVCWFSSMLDDEEVVDVWGFGTLKTMR